MSTVIQRIIREMSPLTVDDSADLLKSIYIQEKAELLKSLSNPLIDSAKAISIKHRLVQVDEFLFDLQSPHRILLMKTYINMPVENDFFLSISNK